MATERSERELNQDINAAIAGTEDEIFRDALEDGELDNDGDTSLEEMGEGLEGDHLDEEIEAENDIEPEAEGDEDAEDGEDEPEEASGEEGEEEDGEDEPEQQPRDQRGRFQDQPRIPPQRLRAESEARRQAEERERQLQSRYETLEARFNDMQARLNAAPPQKPAAAEASKPKPDMFADPEGYEAWVLEQAEQRAANRLERSFAERDQRALQAQNDRVDQSFSTAARGNRGFEFQAAYNRLTSLDPRDPQARMTVQRIYHAPDPQAALFDWWEQNGGPEYREQIIAQLTGGSSRELAERLRSGERTRQDPGSRQQARHEFRPARSLRSLNSASGSNSQRVQDPDMLDGSDSSVFEYATRR